MTFSGLCEARPLVLVSPGGSAVVAARLSAVAPLLAGQLGRDLLGPLEPLQHPDRALTALAAQADRQRASAGLSWLAVDPGLSLADGRPWAEALGAWRQPTLLLLEAAQLECGAAAATAALLRQHGVPLLGLIQWGEPWQPQLRRREGLPWLGALGPDGPLDAGLGAGLGAGLESGLDLRLAVAIAGVALQGAALG